jgi:8-oxo-dGTP pyrophosphatase MutT (NUDIX family)
LVQRLPDKHDEGEAYARWEFPGGRLDAEDSSVWDGALREFGEETGALLPAGFEPRGGWVSDDGVYEGFAGRVPRESDLSLHPQREEVSRAAWWDPADLDDPRIREKVTEQLGDIKPLLKAQFHRHTDAILAHYTPLVQDSMAQVIQGDVVRHAIRAAYTSVHKAMTQTAPGTQNTPKYQRQLQALISSPQTVVGAAGVGAGAALAGPALATAGGVGSAVLALLNAQLSLGALTAVLTALYGDALLQGAYEASQASGKPLPSLGLPDDYWDNWVPGHNDLAAQLPGGTLQELLQAQGIVLRGISETQIHRIGDIIAAAVRDGTPMKATVAKVEEIIHDAARAQLIATTEYSRAVTAARRSIYRGSHVLKLALIVHPDCCHLCRENADASPIGINDSWPNGAPPTHPACRCVETPWIGG